MTPILRSTAAGLVLATLLGAGACSERAETKTAEPAAPLPAATADTHPFRIGRLEAVSLRDGGMILPNDGKSSPWTDTAAVGGLLRAAGADAVQLSIQPLLIRDGERVVLIDTGAAGGMGTEGKLPASLRAAGVEPAQVTDVLISHGHGDHVGGLVADGALAFPNAAIRMSNDEWRALQGAQDVAALIPVITPKVQTFEPGAQVTPSITAVALGGHTPGHSGYEIVSGDDRLLYIGDAMHSALVSVQRPDLVNAWDFNSDAAVATRQNLLQRGATQTLRIYGVHFPWPGVGRFRGEGEGFVWVPEGQPAQP